MMTMQATFVGACCSQASAGLILSAAGNNTKVASRGSVSLKQSQSVRWSQGQRRMSFVRAQPTEQSSETEDYVDYQGNNSVFPDEACEETGENCDAEGVFKEVPYKPQPVAGQEAAEGPDREYEDYAGNKTVFPGEACDDLGGEYCDPDFQKGVYPDKLSAAKK